MFISLKTIIIKQNYIKEDIIKKMDIFMATNQINVEEYDNLYNLLEKYPAL